MAKEVIVYQKIDEEIPWLFHENTQTVLADMVNEFILAATINKTRIGTLGVWVIYSTRAAQERIGLPMDTIRNCICTLKRCKIVRMCRVSRKKPRRHKYLIYPSAELILKKELPEYLKPFTIS